MEKNWLNLFHNKGAIWQYKGSGPHAAYEMAATHSSFYFNTDIVADDPGLLESICKEGFLPLICSAPDVVVTYDAKVKAPEKIARALATELKCKFLDIDLTKVSDLREIKGKKVTIVTDDIHSGKSLQALIKVLDVAGTIIQQPILTLANFSGLQEIENIPIANLIKLSIEAFSLAECPLCSQGSSPIAARVYWQKLMKSTQN